MLIRIFLINLFFQFSSSIKNSNKNLNVPQLLFVTIATEETDGLKRLQKSAHHFGHDLKIFGLGEEWKGGNMYSEVSLKVFRVVGLGEM